MGVNLKDTFVWEDRGGDHSGKRRLLFYLLEMLGGLLKSWVCRIRIQSASVHRKTDENGRRHEILSLPYTDPISKYTLRNWRKWSRTESVVNLFKFQEFIILIVQPASTRWETSRIIDWHHQLFRNAKIGFVIILSKCCRNTYYF